MPVSHKHKTIFVHVPRTAGSGIEHVLGIAGDDNQGALTPPRPDMLFGMVGDKALQHLTARQIRQRLGAETYAAYFKFAIVRNPYDRVVSTYHIRRKHMPHIKMSFDDFVLKRVAGPKPSALKRWFSSKAEKILEDQFDTQTAYIYDETGTSLVDYVGKFETLQSDYQAICGRLGIRADLPVMNRSQHDDYQKYYTDRTREAVQQIYRNDFVNFGYDF